MVQRRNMSNYGPNQIWNWNIIWKVSLSFQNRINNTKVMAAQLHVPLTLVKSITRFSFHNLSFVHPISAFWKLQRDLSNVSINFFKVHTILIIIISAAHLHQYPLRITTPQSLRVGDITWWRNDFWTSAVLRQRLYALFWSPWQWADSQCWWCQLHHNHISVSINVLLLGRWSINCGSLRLN